MSEVGPPSCYEARSLGTSPRWCVISKSCAKTRDGRKAIAKMREASRCCAEMRGDRRVVAKVREYPHVNFGP